jgi:hypothetical protein
MKQYVFLSDVSCTWFKRADVSRYSGLWFYSPLLIFYVSAFSVPSFSSMEQYIFLSDVSSTWLNLLTYLGIVARSGIGGYSREILWPWQRRLKGKLDRWCEFSGFHVGGNMTQLHRIIGAKMVLLGAVDPWRLRHYSPPKRLFSTIVYANRINRPVFTMGLSVFCVT